MIVTPIAGRGGAPEADADAELVAGMCASRGEALEQLFRRYVRLVLRIAQRILNDRAEAEDVTQEVFLEIYRKAHLFSASRGTFRVWLLQYAYHRTLRRKAMLRRRAAYAAEPLEVAAEHPSEAHHPLSRDECRWVLARGFAELSRQQRLTLELTCFEDLPLREVARRLGVSVGCTRHHYYRGLARLRRWADVTAGQHPGERRAASRAGTADGARRQAPRLYVRV